MRQAFSILMLSFWRILSTSATLFDVFVEPRGRPLLAIAAVWSPVVFVLFSVGVIRCISSSCSIFPFGGHIIGSVADSMNIPFLYSVINVLSSWLRPLNTLP